MSNKTLIVVESPAKAKTINKYLGSNYIVEASVGHIKDLIKVRLGVDVNKGFVPTYTTIKGKADIIKRLKQLAEKSAKVMIATDPDREGEAIAWHLAEEIREKNPAIKRVLFNEITKNGIKKGIEDPRDIDEKLFMSQQARRVMDRLIGYQVSPFLSRAMIEKTSQPLSAGRVQSVALRMICEREKEISSFVPIEYWNILGDFQAQLNKNFKARLFAYDGDNIRNPEGSGAASTPDETAALRQKLSELHYIANEEEAKNLIDRIKLEKFYIDRITKKQIKRSPQPPFTTSLLQQEASKRLGFPNKKTMTIAQKLYEGVTIGSETAGLITYMRTDSVRVSPEAQQAALGYILSSYGEDYVPDYPNQYTAKSGNVQDAHEAIRPTSLDLNPSEVRKYLSRDEADLYELIYNRFLASQMKAALLDQTTISIQGGDFIFRATGTVIVFKGFLVVYDDNGDTEKNGKDSSAILPEGLQEGELLKLSNTDPQQSYTKPKPRFTEASLIKDLDELGIGRPSTYAQIVSTLVEREYVEINKKSFFPTELGNDVNEILTKSFPDLFNVDFTAEMEKELDEIAEGEKSYLNVLEEFYQPFNRSLKHAEQHSETPDIPCPICGSPMIIRVSRKGRFLGCSRYPECSGTKPLPKPDAEKQEKKEQIAEGVFCQKCGSPMMIRESRFGRFYGCSNYPECKEIMPLKTGVTCPKCSQGTLIERFSPKARKKFWGCSNYPKCDYITNYEPVHEHCPKCNHSYLEVRFHKVGDTYERYIKCPNCKENFEFKEEAATK